MRMKITYIFCSCALAMAITGAAANAQERQEEKSAQPTQSVWEVPASPIGTTRNVLVPVSVPGFPGTRVALGDAGMSWTMQGPERTIQFASAEMGFENKVVLNAAFSGEMICENIQTLSDGNRIINRSSILMYRDGLGRTRREQVINLPGQAVGGPNERRFIHISDVVGKTIYSIDPTNRTATKSVIGSFGFGTASGIRGTAGAMVLPVPPQIAGRQMKLSGSVLEGSAIKKVAPAYPVPAKAAGAQGQVQVNVTVDESGNVSAAEVVSGHPLLRDAALEAARQWKFRPTQLGGDAVKVQGLLTFNFTLQGKKAEAPEPGQVAFSTPPIGAMPMIDLGNRVKNESRTEQLGTQMVEGIAAEGTRTITTIPAGAIGNERDINIVSERWYSPELQMVVLMKHVDPRYGETTQRLSNIDRNEPDASFFQVPDGYEVKEGFGMKFLEQRLEEMKKQRENEQ
jgi:TonB family protein